jgi:ParB/RepB/Spo0J family partition protein
MTTFAQLPLHAIVPSPTNPRKHFDQAALDELADSIKATGVHTPVLVRPLPANRLEDTAHLQPRPTHELIAGERRYRASVLAKADTIPAMIRELTDDQALEVQIIENLQRQDLSALEEAEGYQSLIDHSGVSAEDVARKIGKSRSYVFGRLKLLDAGQDVRDALRQGMIGREHAQLLARIPSTLLQCKALKEIIRANHPDGVMSSRAAGEWIRKNYMLKIEQAPFDHTDTTLSPRACTICPTRTGADQDIFADVMGADMCTDPSCYDNKVQQHHARRRAQLEAAGHQIIEGDDATELMPYPNSAPEGYARLDDVRDSPTDKPLREELAKLLDKGEVVPVMIVNPHKDGDVLACVPEDQVPQLLERAGRKKAAEELKAERQQLDEKRAKLDGEAREIELRAEYERGWRERVLAAVIDGVRKEPEHEITDTQMRRLSGLLVDHIDQGVIVTLCDMLGVQASTDEEAGHMGAHEHALREWARVGNGHEPADTLTILNAATSAHWYQWMAKRPDDEAEELVHLLGAASDLRVALEQIKAQVQAEITERVTAEQAAAADAAKALLPLAPAAQASGVRGEAKGQGKTGKAGAKKRPAGASAQPAHLNAQEAMQGIAAALQGEEVGPASRPDGAASTDTGAQAGADGAAPSLTHQADAVGDGAGPQDKGLEASGPKTVKVGDQVRITFDSPVFMGKLATVIAINSKGKVWVAVQGLAGEFVFEPVEFELVEGGAA